MSYSVPMRLKNKTFFHHLNLFLIQILIYLPHLCYFCVHNTCLKNL